MADEFECRRKVIIFDYSVYNTDVPFEGERRYFNTILTGITNACSVLGDGVSECNALPFLELINIETNANINLETLQIKGNRVIIKNTSGGDITVNLGTTGTPINHTLATGIYILLIFDGTSWLFIPRKTDNLNISSNLIVDGLGTFNNLDVDTLNLNGNVISDSTGTISFSNENLTTTGQLTSGNSKVRVTKDNAQTFTDGDVLVVQYDDEVYDTNNEFASYTFTAKTAGYYFVSASLLFDSATWVDEETAKLFLFKNGVEYSILERVEQEDTNTHYVHIKGNDTIYLTVGQYIDIRASQTTGGSVSCVANASDNYLSIYRIP